MTWDVWLRMAGGIFFVVLGLGFAYPNKRSPALIMVVAVLYVAFVVCLVGLAWSLLS